MKDNLSYIQIVLDRSGSMGTVREATVSGFNEFVDGQKALPGDAILTLVQFDTENSYELVFDAKPLKEIPKLTVEQYVPRGGTPLHDAIGRSITNLGDKLQKTPEAQRPSTVFIVIMTDGLENASHEYSAPRIAEMIKHQREVYNWQFIFLGANQDAILTGERLNIPRQFSMTTNASPAAVHNVYKSVSAAMGAVRLNNAQYVTFTQQDREDAMAEGEEDSNVFKKKQKK